MKYRYTYNFRTIDKHIIELYNTIGDRVEEVDALYEVYSRGYMIGINRLTDELTLINMANVIRVKVRIEELP